MQSSSQIGLVVGPSDARRWGQVLMQPTGYGVIETESADARAQEIGVNILSDVGNALSSSPVGLRAIEHIVDELRTSVLKSMIVFVPVKNVLYVVMRGEGAVYLRRGSQVAVLMDRPGGISGEVRNGDTLIAASGSFARIFSKDVVASAFDHEMPKVVAEKLTLALHQRQGTEGAVALVYQFQNEETRDTDGAQNEKVGPPKKSTSRISQVSLQFRAFLVRFRQNPEKTRTLLFIGLAGLFLLSVGLGIMKQSSQKMNQTVAGAVASAQHAYDEGIALRSLNAIKARERLTQAKQMLEPIMQNLNTRTPSGRHVEELFQQIQDALAMSMQISKAEPALFYDMSLLKQGAVASVLALEDDTLVVGDTAQPTLYTIDIGSKKASIIGGGGDVAGLRLVSLHGERIYALASSGILEFTSQKKQPHLVIPSSKEWGVIGAMVAFGGNIYLTDFGKNRIWKYISVDNAKALNAESVEASESASVSSKEAYSDMREYLTPDTFPDFSTATNMSIDGTVWVGSRSGHPYHFIQGREETFVPKGVEPVLGADTLLFVTDTTQSLYVLDRQNNRVVVLDPDGMYLAQYQWSDMGIPQAFAVSETRKKIFLLIGGKIYSLELTS